MRRIGYSVGGTIMRAKDAAFIQPGEADLASAVAEAVVSTIQTEVEVKLGGKVIHLSMLLDPDHWEGDWEEIGVPDVEEFLAGLVGEEE